MRLILLFAIASLVALGDDDAQVNRQFHYSFTDIVPGATLHFESVPLRQAVVEKIVERGGRKFRTTRLQDSILAGGKLSDIYEQADPEAAFAKLGESGAAWCRLWPARGKKFDAGPHSFLVEVSDIEVEYLTEEKRYRISIEQVVDDSRSLVHSVICHSEPESRRLDLAKIAEITGAKVSQNRPKPMGGKLAGVVGYLFDLKGERAGCTATPFKRGWAITNAHCVEKLETARFIPDFEPENLFERHATTWNFLLREGLYSLLPKFAARASAVAPGDISLHPGGVDIAVFKVPEALPVIPLATKDDLAKISLARPYPISMVGYSRGVREVHSRFLFEPREKDVVGDASLWAHGCDYDPRELDRFAFLNGKVSCHLTDGGSSGGPLVAEVGGELKLVGLNNSGRIADVTAEFPQETEVTQPLRMGVRGEAFLDWVNSKTTPGSP